MSKVERARKAMTDTFKTFEQLSNYLVLHLYDLYHEIGQVTDFSSDWDYLSGSIETTQVYLEKSGIKYLDHTAYIEREENAKWVKA
jgi:hypothetical protein